MKSLIAISTVLSLVVSCGGLDLGGSSHTRVDKNSSTKGLQFVKEMEDGRMVYMGEGCTPSKNVTCLIPQGEFSLVVDPTLLETSTSAMAGTAADITGTGTGAEAAAGAAGGSCKEIIKELKDKLAQSENCFTQVAYLESFCFSGTYSIANSENCQRAKNLRRQCEANKISIDNDINGLSPECKREWDTQPKVTPISQPFTFPVPVPEPNPITMPNINVQETCQTTVYVAGAAYVCWWVCKIGLAPHTGGASLCLP